MNLQVVISLLATAISFLDAHIAEVSRQGADITLYVDVKHILGAAIAQLRGDTDADDKLEFINQKRKDKKQK